MIWQSYLKHPIFGQGAGSTTQFALPGLSHPHNDYLLLAHDYGAVGFALWVISTLAIAFRLLQNVLQSARHDDGLLCTHLTALLALLAVSLTMITDNSSIYLYVMAPLAVLVGASLGSAGSISPLVDSEPVSQQLHISYDARG